MFDRQQRSVRRASLLLAALLCGCGGGDEASDLVSGAPSAPPTVLTSTVRLRDNGTNVGVQELTLPVLPALP